LSYKDSLPSEANLVRMTRRPCARASRFRWTAAGVVSEALNVSSSLVASMVISPTASTIAAGDTQQYTVTGYDGMGHSLGDVTGSTVLTVTDPNVTCTANVCGSSTPGTYTITATNGIAQTSAALTVSVPLWRT